MKNIVIGEFPVLPDKVDELERMFSEILDDTRAFEGCISLELCFEEATSTFVAVGHWESFEHYDRYLNWRVETGLADRLSPVLVNGMDSFRVRKLMVKDI